MKDRIKYYFWATYHRKILDKLQEKYKYFYKGIVLDIGGRDRGKFVKPRDKVKKWIFTDIEKKHKPDIVLDVANMKQIKSNSIDVVNAINLFEHVEYVERGLKECYRVLKKNGKLIISAPFLYPIHADPYDFQRWTEERWMRELIKVGFKIEKIEIIGRYFAVLCDMVKDIIKSLPFGFKHFGYLVYPLFDILVKFDNTNMVKNNELLDKYHGGYFIIARKS